MALELQVAGICFDAEDWRDFDDETRAALLAAAENDFGGGSPGFAGRGAEAEPEPFDEEPTLIRARAREVA